MAKQTSVIVITGDEGSVIAVIKHENRVNKAIKQYYESVNDDEKIISIRPEDKYPNIIVVISKDDDDDDITRTFYLTDATYYQ